MLKVCLSVLALSGVVLTSQAAAFYAARIVGYDPGIGHAPNFTHPEAALGEPSRVNPFGEATDPFNPPYGTNQIVSIGAGGSLTVRFHRPILNHPRNLGRLDFAIFGNSGFIITNEFDLSTFTWIGTPATDGSLFGQNTGDVRVSVSHDGKRFYTLDSELAPSVDSFPPTDGAGHFGLPLDPRLAAEDFAGATLDGIRSLYNGSGGGASYDISWARDDKGRRVFLPFIRFIRVEVLSGKVEIDGFATVERVPRWWEHKQ
jgi:hypothetical protein